MAIFILDNSIIYLYLYKILYVMVYYNNITLESNIFLERIIYTLTINGILGERKFMHNLFLKT